MFLLGIHIISIALLVMVVSATAYNVGIREGERRELRREELARAEMTAQAKLKAND